MKFEYGKTVDKERKPVAWLYRMEPPPYLAHRDRVDELALCIATTDPERFIWAYSDGEFTVQSTPPTGEALKVFYEGDSLTITF